MQAGEGHIVRRRGQGEKKVGYTKVEEEEVFVDLAYSEDHRFVEKFQQVPLEQG